MPNRVSAFLGAVIALIALSTMFACRQPPGAASDSTSAPMSASPAAGPADTSASPGDPASPPQSLCSQVTPADLSAITSASYAETNSQIDTAAMKHCEYRGGPNVVSIMLVLGADAPARFELSTKFPGIQPVAGVGDQANWEAVRGTLSVLANGRAVEVRVSPSHGAGSTQQQFARQIAELILSR